MTEFVRSFAGRFALAALVVSGTFSCSKPAKVECSPVALVDTAGERLEKVRVEFQWMAIKVGLDSALRTSAGIEAHRASEGALDAAIARYRDSLKPEGNGVVSKSGCIDWAATWSVGRFDRAAMATAMLRGLGKDSVSAVEWTADSAANSDLRLHVVYSVRGADGGGIDSAILRLEPTMVSIAPK